MDKKDTKNTLYSINPIVIAHRGGGKIHGDNTLRSIEESMKMGVDYIEIDVRKTKDEVIILYHNSWIQCGGGIVYIHDMTYDDLYNVKSDICRLDELLMYISTRQYIQVCINMDIKEEGITDDIWRIIYEYIENGKLGYENFMFTSFCHTQILYMKDKFEQMQCGIIFDIYDEGLDIRDDIKIIVLNIDSIDTRTIDKIKQKQKHVWLYTINTEREIKLALDLEVDGIITDVPDYVMLYVNNNNMHKNKYKI